MSTLDFTESDFVPEAPTEKGDPRALSLMLDAARFLAEAMCYARYHDAVEEAARGLSVIASAFQIEREGA